MGSILPPQPKEQQLGTGTEHKPNQNTRQRISKQTVQSWSCEPVARLDCFGEEQFTEKRIFQLAN